MNKEKKEKSKKKSYRFFTAIIYEDSTSYSYNDILLTCMEWCDEFAYIIHDKDVYDSDDIDETIESDDNEQKISNIVVGELKKKHTHILLRFENARSLDCVSKKLNLPKNYIKVGAESKKEHTRRFPGAVRYLVHADDDFKAQYSIGEIKGTLKNVLKYFTTMEESDIAINMLELRDNGYTWRDVFYKMCEIGQFNGFRRNYKMVSFIREEGNIIKYDEIDYFLRKKYGDKINSEILKNDDQVK